MPLYLLFFLCLTYQLPVRGGEEPLSMPAYKPLSFDEKSQERYNQTATRAQTQATTAHQLCTNIINEFSLRQSDINFDITFGGKRYQKLLDSFKKTAEEIKKATETAYQKSMKALQPILDQHGDTMTRINEKLQSTLATLKSVKSLKDPDPLPETLPPLTAETAPSEKTEATTEPTPPVTQSTIAREQYRHADAWLTKANAWITTCNWKLVL